MADLGDKRLYYTIYYTIGDNKKIAELRYHKHMKRLDANPVFKEKVREIFDGQLEKDILAEVTRENDDPSTQKHCRDTLW